MIRVVIADDEAIIGNGIKLLLEQDNEIQGLACVENGREALEICKKEPVDLVLMDISMPICDGIEGTRLIKNYDSGIKVLILTTFYDEQIILSAFNNGADGYILKGIRPEEFISTVKGVVKGLKVMNQDVFNTVLKHLAPQGSAQPTKAPLDNLDLNETELQIIHLIVQGKTNRQIASTMHLSSGRISNIITVILSKFSLSDRTQLAVYAVRNRLV